MISTRRLLSLGLGGATAALLAGYVLLGSWQWVPLILVIGGGWFFGRRRWGWAGSVGFLLYVVLAAGGVIYGVASGWMLVAVAGALFAWDLDCWIRRQQSISLDQVPQIMERRHLSRLLAVIGMGVLLALVPLVIPLRLSFWMSLALALFAALGLGRMVAFLTREGD